MISQLQTINFDFDLKSELIAQYPMNPRDCSKLLYVSESGQLHDMYFYNIIKLLRSTDLIVFNDTKVINSYLCCKVITNDIVLDDMLNYTDQIQSSLSYSILDTTFNIHKNNHISIIRLNLIHLIQSIDLCSHNDLSNKLKYNNKDTVVWDILAKPSKKLTLGAKLLFFDHDFKQHDVFMLGKVIDIRPPYFRIEFYVQHDEFYRIIEKIGRVPLPPYIKRNKVIPRVDDISTSNIANDFNICKLQNDINNNSAKDTKLLYNDSTCYQTVYGKNPGAVAAPTAGLHFTNELLNKITQMGIEHVNVTLHVGAGTFLPIKSEFLHEHIMHSENYIIDNATIKKIYDAKMQKRRIVCVGTTSLRVLESAVTKFTEYAEVNNTSVNHAQNKFIKERLEKTSIQGVCKISNEYDNKSVSYSDNSYAVNTKSIKNIDMNNNNQTNYQSTNLFITPGYKFKMVDVLITNFHLPKSTLFALVCAFSGYDVMRSTYHHAILNNYRFFSYGDACFLELQNTNAENKYMLKL